MAIKKRADSFFGLHFDFHANPARGFPLQEIGARTTEDMVQRVIDAVKPDFLQIDCKGHPGFCSYPTEVGNPYPLIKGDPLKIWRAVTRKNGVGLYMHYSGVIDDEAMRQHPEWAKICENGDPDGRSSSTFGPYVDELLIPQMKELAGKYGVDGIWVDGECWGTGTDFSEKALALFKEETGVDLTGDLPTSPEHPYYEQYRDFCREAFRRYVGHYTDEIHKDYPDFQVASNWAYSTWMPEKVTTNVDFISGDLTPGDAYNRARFEARGLAPQGKPWDLMAWGFSMNSMGEGKPSARSPKHPAQLMQEGAAAVSLGGGFQIYITQNRDGSVKENQAAAMGAVGEFLRARKPYAFRGTVIPQAVILNSTTDYYLNSPGLFANAGYESINGLVTLMCDIQQCVEMRSEHNLTGHLADWPLIVLPDLHKTICDEFKAELLAYVRDGGHLVLTGRHTLEVFAELGIVCEDLKRPHEFMPAFASADGKAFGCLPVPTAALPEMGGETLAYVSLSDDGIYGDHPVLPLAQKISYGQGAIVAVATDLGGAYHRARSFNLRAVMRRICDSLYEPMVRVTGNRYIDIVPLKKDGQLMLQLINSAGEHNVGSCLSFDEIPPVGPYTVSVRLDKAPERVTLQPYGREIQGTYQNGVYTAAIDRLDLYDVLVFE